MKKALLFLSLFSFLGFASCEDDKKEQENPTSQEIKYTIIWDELAPLTDIIINECDKNDNVKGGQYLAYIPARSGMSAETRTFTTTVPNITKIEVFSKSDGKYFYDSKEVKNNRCDILIGTKEITLEEYNEGISR